MILFIPDVIYVSTVYVDEDFLFFNTGRNIRQPEPIKAVCLYPPRALMDNGTLIILVPSAHG
jgi:hypothetical protein